MVASADGRAQRARQALPQVVLFTADSEWPDDARFNMARGSLPGDAVLTAGNGCKDPATHEAPAGHNVHSCAEVRLVARECVPGEHGAGVTEPAAQ